MSNLHTRVSIVDKRKRVGRGGSRGGTSGRGTKGQKARSGAGRKIGVAFEGGQMPLHRRLPKRGFNNDRFMVSTEIINIEQLEQFFNIDEQVTRESLIEKGLLYKRGARVKLLGKGVLTKKLYVVVDACSQQALQAVTSCGGEVNLIEKKA